jgi:hypothetical protein
MVPSCTFLLTLSTRPGRSTRLVDSSSSQSQAVASRRFGAPTGAYESLSAPQAFEAMRRYLTAYWERGGRQESELMLVLSEMNTTTWKDGGTADPAAWHDWEPAVSETLATGP